MIRRLIRAAWRVLTWPARVLAREARALETESDEEWESRQW